jgi:hypothetical protein
MKVRDIKEFEVGEQVHVYTREGVFRYIGTIARGVTRGGSPDQAYIIVTNGKQNLELVNISCVKRQYELDMEKLEELYGEV